MIGLDRLSVIGAGLLAAALAMPAAAQDTVTVVSFGGTYQDAMRKGAYEPIARKLGLTLKEDNLKGYADIRLQVQGGRPTWDVIEGGSQFCTRGTREGVFEKLDYSLIPNANDIDPKLRHEGGVGGPVYFSMVMAWNPAKFATPPKDWKDFFDVAKFPGRRAVYNQSRFMIEIGLLADGVEPDKLYPLDVRRSIAKFASIRKNISVFYTSHGQAVQLVKDGEVDMIAILNGRIDAALKDGAKWDYTFNQGIIDSGCLAVPKGAPNKVTAMKFINEFLSPDIQANLPLVFAYGPVNPKAFQTGKISAEAMKTITSAPDNIKTQVLFNTAWWTDNEARTEAQWDEFLQK